MKKSGIVNHIIKHNDDIKQSNFIDEKRLMFEEFLKKVKKYPLNEKKWNS